MQTSNNSNEIKINRRSTRSSTTLSRRYAKRPKMENEIKVNIKKSPKVTHFGVKEPAVESKTVLESSTVSEMLDTPAIKHPMQKKANAIMKAQNNSRGKSKNNPKISSKDMKEQAIKKAMLSASTVKSEKSKKPRKKMPHKLSFGVGKIILALSCSAAVAAAIVYFVNLNMPDFSMQVAAMQNGINPTYPGYVPMDYKVSGIVSEEGKITINFTNSSAGKEFSLIEEKSSWNTDALLNNYVKDEYGDNYTAIKEQGLTIYISDSNAAWVNGGNVYKIIAKNDTLTNKQIRSIAASL